MSRRGYQNTHSEVCAREGNESWSRRTLRAPRRGGRRRGPARRSEVRRRGAASDGPPVPREREGARTAGVRRGPPAHRVGCERQATRGDREDHGVREPRGVGLQLRQRARRAHRAAARDHAPHRRVRRRQRRRRRARRTSSTTRYFVTGFIDMAQPLPTVTGTKLGDLASQVSKSFQASRKQVPDFVNCMHKYQNNDLDGAIVSARAAITIYPNSTVGRVCLANAWVKKDYNSDSIVGVATRVTELDPRNKLAWDDPRRGIPQARPGGEGGRPGRQRALLPHEGRGSVGQPDRDRSEEPAARVAAS